MFLQEAIERLRTKKDFKTAPATVYRIFEVYEESQKNESGEKPVFVQPNVTDKKRNRD